jgi:hypothetical protein
MRPQLVGLLWGPFDPCCLPGSPALRRRAPLRTFLFCMMTLADPK